MQSILSLDVSCEPACLQVVEVDGSVLRIVESHKVSLGSAFAREQLCHQAPEPSPATAEQPAQTQDLAPDDNSSDANSSVDSQNGSQMLAQLGEAVRSIKAPWTNSVLIIPPHDHLSLVLDCPFGDERRLDKIIDLEIQDRVPFDLSEFLVEYQPLGQNQSQHFDVHVSIIPKIAMQNALRLCRSVDLEPFVVTTPASVLEALFHIAPDYFSADAALMLAQSDTLHLLVRFQSKVRGDRVIRLPLTENGSPDKSQALAELKLSICEVESRFERSIERLYILGDSLHSSDVQKLLGRSVEQLRLGDFVDPQDKEVCLASLAPLFAQDSLEPPVLINLRTREFVYSPRLRELLDGMRRLVPYFLSALLCGFLALVTIFVLRENLISRMQEAAHTQIREVVPDLALKEGEEVNQIMARNSKLEEELGKLGSPSRYSPLDAFREISLDFQKLPGATLRSLTIQGNRIRVEGTVNAYSDLDAMEKALRARKNVYCRIPQPEPSRAGGNQVNFDLKLWTCE